MLYSNLKNVKILTIFILIVFFISCEYDNSNIQRLYGQWVIEEVEYNNKPYKKHLLTNNFRLKKNNEIFIPETFLQKKDYSPTWFLTVENNKKFIEIETLNKVFNGKFQIILAYDKGKGLKLEMKSDSTYIKAYKLLSSF